MRRALPSSFLSGLSDFVAARIGLHFPQERWGDLERGVVAAAREFGYPDAESCARWLLSAPLTRNHIEVLASHLTVGETYFFREERSFEVLEQQILPELFRSRRDGERRIRIWSAGCCTGEEAYSIAVLLDRLIPDPGAWNVTVLATDINPRFLRKAAQGVYGEWSFRSAPEWIRTRYFEKTKDGRFALSPQIRNRVTFSYLNLADDVYPSLVNNTNAMDVIFCRNVLMYFTAERAKQVSRNLHRSLVEGGWLVVSPTETSNALFSSFSPVPFPGVVLYRKAAAGFSLQADVAARQVRFAAESGASPFQAPVVPSHLDIPETAQYNFESEAQQEPARPAAPETGAALASEQDDGHALSATARSCANQGRLAEAVEWCEKAIAADRLNPGHYYLLATIQQEQAQADAAAQSLTRALYLDSNFALAHFALGNLRLSQGRRREAERNFRNALAVLRARPHDEVLPEADGLTAGRLAEIIASALASQPRAAA